jgi:CheY-like chemotaxis protein
MGAKTFAEAEAAPSSKGRMHLLLVDDDAAIGRVVSRILRDTFDVTVFTNAREAVDAIAGGARYAAILCDLMMPAMTGMDLYESVAGLDRPSVDRIVFLTGGAFTRRAEDFLRAVKNPRLEKPFDRAALMSALAQVLEGTPP